MAQSEQDVSTMKETTHKEQGYPSEDSVPAQELGDKFVPYTLGHAPSIPCGLPPEIWTMVQSVPARSSPQYFLDVSHNLLENPNLTASHLARAELSYKSFTDATFNPKAESSENLASIIKHLRPECRPRLVEGGIEGFDLEWTVVRKLIPRNPKLDDALMQTCHLFTSKQDITIKNHEGKEEIVSAERYMVIYIPHASTPEEIPFYHPKVRALAILYTFLPNHDITSVLPTAGTLSIYYSLFNSYELDNRLSRTGLKLLEIIHKHSRGRQAGYRKRVHHDQVIPQKRFQDTYAYLKGKYAKELIDGWVEQTPPEKHVFEDLGIAAFLIELWSDMYAGSDNTVDENAEDESVISRTRAKVQKNFPGFVDIGCGNGLLIYILNAEGWTGWGFDARHRKTWDTFPAECTSKLSAKMLVPQILQPETVSEEEVSSTDPPSHNGVFPPGTFIISNHADELTPWTPLLAHLNSSPFIAIPCCSHDLGGTRFRAPPHTKFIEVDPNENSSKGKNKQPSAYASLCSWVCHLSESVGFKVEKEHLRIPSTRNVAILGRVKTNGEDQSSSEQKMEEVRRLVEKEMGGQTTVEQVGLQWMRSCGLLVKPGKGGH